MRDVSSDFAFSLTFESIDFLCHLAGELGYCATIVISYIEYLLHQYFFS